MYKFDDYIELVRWEFFDYRLAKNEKNEIYNLIDKLNECRYNLDGSFERTVILLEEKNIELANGDETKILDFNQLMQCLILERYH